jgi:glutamate-1-semialdehyde 2,1-aminomutase
LVLTYNDVEGLEAAFSAHGDKIAAVILEPVCGNMGCVTPTPEFLKSLRKQTHDFGAVLIFDEVMCGFRVAPGGAQELFGVMPDMTTMGKIVGGGLPLAVFGGRRDIMQHVLPAGKVFQAGTLSGNPIATAAGIAMLKSLRDHSPYERLESLSHRLADGLVDAASAAGVEHCLQRVGSMMTLFFQNGPVTDWDSAAQSNTKMFSKYFWGLIERGVYMPCSQFEALFVSAAHTESDIDHTVAMAKEVLASL